MNESTRRQLDYAEPGPKGRGPVRPFRLLIETVVFTVVATVLLAGLAILVKSRLW